MATFKKTVFSMFYAGAFALAALGASADDLPVVSGLKATPVAPWGVALDYTLTGSAETDDWVPSVSLITTDAAGVTTTNVATELVGDTNCANGAHRVYWNLSEEYVSWYMGDEFLTRDVTNATISVRYTVPNYYVIDLSTGTKEGSSYSVTPLDALPRGWETNAVYKTSKLVLKRVDPGTFVMGSDQTNEAKRATIEKPYYLGVFEVTQAQWELVASTNAIDSGFIAKSAANVLNPAATTIAFSSPRGGVSFKAVHGEGDDVDSDSFLGKLNARSGKSFDLPTAAQWEYACRAGMTTAYSYGDAANGVYMWSKDNASGKAHDVGAKQANGWGFYDMHGNVAEWCLDYDGRKRVARGGAYSRQASECKSFSSISEYQTEESAEIGFRLVWSPVNGVPEAAAVTNVALSVGEYLEELPDGFEITCAPTDAEPAVVKVGDDVLLDTGTSAERSCLWQQPTVGGLYVLTHTVGDVTLCSYYPVWLPVVTNLSVTAMDGWGARIDYDLGYSPATTDWMPEIVMISEDKATTNVAKTVSGMTGDANGPHSVYWNMSADDLTNDWKNVTIELRYVTSDTNGVVCSSPTVTSDSVRLTVEADAGMLVRGKVADADGYVRYYGWGDVPDDIAVVRAYSADGALLAECETDAGSCYAFALPAGETVRLWATSATNAMEVAESDAFVVTGGTGPKLCLDNASVGVEWIDWDEGDSEQKHDAWFASLSAALQCAKDACATPYVEPEVTLRGATTLPWSVDVTGEVSLWATTRSAEAAAVTCTNGASIYVAADGELTVSDVVFKSDVNEGATIVVASNGVLNVTGGTVGLGRVALDPHATFAASRREADWTLAGDGILLDVGDDRAFEGAVFGTYDKEADAAAVATSNYVGKIVCYNDPTLVGEAQADGTMCWRRAVTRTPVASAVTVTPVSPWGVAIDYTLANAPTNALYWQPSVCLVTTATNGVATTNVAETLVGATNCVNGAHRVYWNMAADGLSAAMTNVAVGVGYLDMAFASNVTVTVVGARRDLEIPFAFDLVPNGTTSAVLKVEGEVVATTNKTGVFTWETEKRGRYYEMEHVVGDATLAATYFVPLQKIEVDDGTDGKGGSASTFSYVGRFDNKGHNIDVSVANPTNVTIKYSFYKYGPYTETLEITNVCTRTPVWYKISAEGYQDYVSWATVTINEYEYWWCSLAPEGEAAGVDLSKTAKTYNGYLMSDDGTTVGSFTLKANRTGKNSASSKAVVTLQVAGEKKQTLRGTLNSKTGVLTVTTKDGRTLSLVVGEDGVTGTFDGYDLDGASDVFSSKDATDKALAKELLAKWSGYLTVMSDRGTFSVAVKSRGKVRVSGTLTDGSSVSQTTQLIAGDTCDYIPVALAKKSAKLAFGLWLDPEGDEIWVSGLGDTAFAGRPGTPADEATFALDTDAMAEMLGDDTYLDLLPDGAALERSGAKWVVVDEENPSKLKLSYKAQTGVVTGSFRAFYNNRNGRKKAKSAKVSGVLIDGVVHAWSVISGVGAAEAEVASEEETEEETH